MVLVSTKREGLKMMKIEDNFLDQKEFNELQNFLMGDQFVWHYNPIIDFQDDTIEYIPVSLNECSWIVVNSQIQRELSNSAYIQRVNECKDGLEILKGDFNISTCRDVDWDMLLALQTTHNVLYKRWQI